MFGWEFPPFFAGGVGMVCYELTKQLTKMGIEIDYVMPFKPNSLRSDFLNLLNASDFVSREEAESQTSINITKVKSLLTAYQTEEEYENTLKTINKYKKKGSLKTCNDNTHKLYGDNLLEEINLFAQRVSIMVEEGLFEEFSVIHAHDWTTVPAAVVVKRMTEKPLVVHVHITEFNKNSGKGVNKQIYDIERQGFMSADIIITVSQNIKETLIKHYGVPPEKIRVVHNGNVKMTPVKQRDDSFKGDNKVVSYLGRVTGMKNPELFVEMAAKVLKFHPKTKFVMGGTGDRLQACIDRTKELGIFDKFYFHGFYNREDADFFYDISDVFVLPSIREPFGVTPLEAMCKDTPTIVTKQSGVAEVIKHAFKVDWWDVDKMASLVISLLKYPVLHKTMKKFGRLEANNLDWQEPARKCIMIYNELTSSEGI